MKLPASCSSPQRLVSLVAAFGELAELTLSAGTGP